MYICVVIIIINFKHPPPILVWDGQFNRIRQVKGLHYALVSALVWFLQIDVFPNANHFTKVTGCFFFHGTNTSEVAMYPARLRSLLTEWGCSREWCIELYARWWEAKLWRKGVKSRFLSVKEIHHCSHCTRVGVRVISVKLEREIK